jgi:hypothetical protein
MKRVQCPIREVRLYFLSIPKFFPALSFAPVLLSQNHIAMPLVKTTTFYKLNAL